MTMKPYFRNKGLNSNLQLEKDVLIINKGEIVKKFNERFINIALGLKLRY